MKDKVKEIALNEGACKVGIASVERFEGAPKGHAPTDFIPDAKSVVSFGVRLLDTAVEWDKLFRNSEIVPEELRVMLAQGHIYETAYSIVNTRLDQIGLSIALFLEGKGYRSMCLPATFNGYCAALMGKIPNFHAPFCHRHAAVRAGLGEFGLNDLVLTPEYGPRIRFNSVITSVKLGPDPIIKEKLCIEKCSLCVKNCGVKALKVKENLNWNEIWLDPPSIVDKHACDSRMVEAQCVGRCIRVCPVGGKRKGGNEAAGYKNT
jgi:epoxyqueuosine reductase QueG